VLYAEGFDEPNTLVLGGASKLACLTEDVHIGRPRLLLMVAKTSNITQYANTGGIINIFV
jgi:hypothetical protein